MNIEKEYVERLKDCAKKAGVEVVDAEWHYELFFNGKNIGEVAGESFYYGFYKRNNIECGFRCNKFRNIDKIEKHLKLAKTTDEIEIAETIDKNEFFKGQERYVIGFKCSFPSIPFVNPETGQIESTQCDDIKDELAEMTGIYGSLKKI